MRLRSASLSFSSSSKFSTSASAEFPKNRLSRWRRALWLACSRLVSQIQVEDSDEMFKRAIDAGTIEIMPMTDMFFGSREGRVRDPFGNVWTIASLKEEVAPEEMQRKMTAQVTYFSVSPMDTASSQRS